MNYGFKVTGTLLDGNTRSITCAVEDMGSVVKVTVPKRELDGKLYATVEIESALSTAEKHEKGDMFFPTTFGSGFCMCYLDDKPDTGAATWLSGPPVGGICETDNACFIRIEGMRDTARFHVGVKNGVYFLNPRIDLEDDDPDEDVTVYFRVSDVFRDVYLVVKDGEKELLRRKKQKLAPGEMETVKITKSMLEGLTTGEIKLGIE